MELAEKVKGHTSPNPAVGCVLVQDSSVVGKGATRPWGESHAEVVALQEAGERARGATVYVTLEPCVDYPGKRTPSCAEALVRAGVRRVFVGSLDPNPFVRGKGIALLREAGIDVVLVDDYHRELLDLNQDFFKYIQVGLPYVTAKYAMTLDGQIATPTGDSQWISGESSRRLVHHIRSRVDAVMVGIGTVLRDNPQLTVRMVSSDRQPLRVIVDPRGETPEEAFVYKDSYATLFLVLPGYGERLRLSGKEVWEMGTSEGEIPLGEVLRRLAEEKKIASLMVEGGGRLLYRLLHGDFIDKVLVFVGPKLVGGKGIAPFEGRGYDRLDTLQVQRWYAQTLENDVVIHAYLKVWDV